jgi:HlyD family secretion protein
MTEGLPMLTDLLALLTKPRMALHVGQCGHVVAFEVASLCVAFLFSLAPAAAAEISATDPPSSLPVTVAAVRQRCFNETLESAGRVVPREEVLVRPEIEGLRIAQVLVEDGDRVTQGQVLARLERLDGQAGPLPSAATIKSPNAGVISYRGAQSRAVASVRGGPLFRLIVDGEIELEAEIAATRLSKLAPGQSASVEIAGLTEPVTGNVRSVSTAIDPKTQMASARIFLGDRKLPIGAFAKVVVVVGQRCGSSIPLSAVLYRSDGPIVQVVRGARVETRRVEVGLLSGGNVEIRDGLKNGEMVVARSAAFVRDGDSVRAIAPNESTTSSR